MSNAALTKKYSKGDVTVVWEASKCIHAGACVRGLPEVFDPKARPWVNMEGADNQAIINQVNQCPSGALSILSADVTTMISNVTSAKVIENGPLIIEGDCKVTLANGSEVVKNKKASICRCGASENKPFCDGAHKRIGFEG